MASWNYVWDANETQIISTGGGWSTLSGTTEIYSDAINFQTDGELGASIHFEVNFDSTPTDHVDFKLYGSNDGTTYARVPFRTIRLDKATDTNITTHVVEGNRPYVRVGASQSGATDSHDVRCYYKQYTGENA